MMRGGTENLVWRVQKEGNTKENTSFFKHQVCFFSSCLFLSVSTHPWENKKLKN